MAWLVTMGIRKSGHWSNVSGDSTVVDQIQPVTISLPVTATLLSFDCRIETGDDIYDTSSQLSLDLPISFDAFDVFDFCPPATYSLQSPFGSPNASDQYSIST